MSTRRSFIKAVGLGSVATSSVIAAAGAGAGPAQPSAPKGELPPTTGLKFVGYRGKDRTTMIGVVGADGSLFPVAEAAAFYRNLPKWLAVAQRASAGRGGLTTYEERAPMDPAGRIICVGVNYLSHVQEGQRNMINMKDPLPEYKWGDNPIIFSRWTKSGNCNGGEIPLNEEKLDWEGELGVVIGKEMSHVSEAAALDGVLGYAPFNDVSARTFQLHTTQWAVGKNSDGSGVVGAFVTKEAVGDISKGLRLQTIVNGKVWQDFNTAEMHFTIPQVIAYISQVVTLCPGDVIAMGTAAGVGFAQVPQVFMKVGDTVEVTVERIGSIKNKVVARKDWVPYWA